ncbi:MAG: hypothetical protein HOO91_21490 [Bacteroidales bacterium]|nr:hypothetical protein [Bacteroidales bacterium]
MTILDEQIKNCLNLGFHKHLGLSEQEYKDSFRTKAIQPVEYKGIFDYPVLVETRIPVKDLLMLSKIGDFINVGNIKHQTDENKTPYIFWTHDLMRYKGNTISETQSKCLDFEIGCSIIEVVSFAIQYPHLCKGKAIDSPITIFKGDYFASLIVHQEKTELASHWINDRTEGFYSLTRGK